MGAGADFEHTSALRVSVILLCFVVISVVVEKALHALEHYFEHHHRHGMKEVLARLKDEILLVGFLSLLLLAVEDKLLTLCVGSDTFNSAIPADASQCAAATGASAYRRLGLEVHPSSEPSSARGLGAAAGESPCGAEGESFVSAAALHQTHILIFLNAACHIIYCSLTMFMTEHRASGWTKYEAMVTSGENVSDDMMVTMQSQVPTVYEKEWKQFAAEFCGQFTGGVNALTYIALRNWFVAKHNLDYTYSFHEYIMRCIHKDFSNTMGVRWWMWLLMILNILSDGYNFGNIGLPTATVMLAFGVGWKLNKIARTLTRKSFDLHDYNANEMLDEEELVAMRTGADTRVSTMAEVVINDELFWFGKPGLLLVCIQCVMFQNALELAFAAFYAWQIGTGACFFTVTGVYVFIRMCLSGFLLFHNAVIMLPTYSLVVQMGNRFNKEIFADSVRKRLTGLALLKTKPSDLLHRLKKHAGKTVAGVKNATVKVASTIANATPGLDNRRRSAAARLDSSGRGGSGGARRGTSSRRRPRVSDPSGLSTERKAAARGARSSLPPRPVGLGLGLGQSAGGGGAAAGVGSMAMPPGSLATPKGGGPSPARSELLPAPRPPMNSLARKRSKVAPLAPLGSSSPGTDGASVATPAVSAAPATGQPGEPTLVGSGHHNRAAASQAEAQTAAEAEAQEAEAGGPPLGGPRPSWVDGPESTSYATHSSQWGESQQRWPGAAAHEAAAAGEGSGAYDDAGGHGDDGGYMASDASHYGVSEYDASTADPTWASTPAANDGTWGGYSGYEHQASDGGYQVYDAAYEMEAAPGAGATVAPYDNASTVGPSLDVSDEVADDNAAARGS